jgi:transcriptional regulator with XRE-family HTH domain
VSILGLSPPPTRRQEFAEFLRLRREATAPDAVGLAAGGNRRTPGLRREEVSQLAGVGLSWYTWLEQGREITPSAGVLDALARVYDLDVPERAHLFDLAGVPLAASAGPYLTEAPPELLEVVTGFEPNAAYLLGPRMDILAWNRGCERMFGTVPPGPDGTPNLMWWLFTRSRPDDADWSATGRNTVAATTTRASGR